jgi:hypothetical protein
MFPEHIQKTLDRVEELGNEMLKIAQVWVGENEDAFKVMKAKDRGIILSHEAAEKMIEIAVVNGVTRFPGMDRYNDLGSELEPLFIEANDLVANFYG